MALSLAILEATAVFVAVWVAALSAPGVPWLSRSGVAWHAVVLAVCSVTAFHHWDLYELQTARRFSRSAPRVALAMAAVVAVLGLARWLPPLAPAPLAGALVAALAMVLGLRAAASGWMARRKPFEHVLVVGGGTLATQLVDAIESRPDRAQRVLGLVAEGGAVASRRLHLGTLRDLDLIVDRVRPDRVIVALASRRGQMPFKTLLGLRVRGIAVEDGADTYERLTGKVPIEALTPTSLIFSKDSRSYRFERAMAWSLGLPAVVVGLLLLAPLFALIALAVRLDSPGPVFFVQPRVGQGGRLFRLFKFRTMRPASGATSEWARDNHSRLTRVGRWLRRFRLDELPQLVNVVKGDMNLVGPRPHPVSNLPMLVLVARNTPECGEQIPFYALRSVVRPGITGWAQVRYQYANDLEQEIEKMRYDLYYIKHRSLWLDLRILLETVKIVMRGRESAEDAGQATGRLVPALPAQPPPAIPLPGAPVLSTARLEAALAPEELPPAPAPDCRTVIRA